MNDEGGHLWTLWYFISKAVNTAFTLLSSNNLYSQQVMLVNVLFHQIYINVL